MKRVLCWVLMLCFLVGGSVPFVYGGDYGTAPPNPVSSSSYHQGGGSYGGNRYAEEDDYVSTAPVPEGEYILFDAAVLRPLGLISMGVGLVGTIIAAPWMASSQSEDRVSQEFLKKPYDYTFCRKLGDIDY